MTKTIFFGHHPLAHVVPLVPARPLSPPAEEPLGFEAVYERNFAFVWRNAQRLGVDPGLLDDVVQDTFLVVHRKLHEFERRAELRTWLFAILRRVIADYRRTVRRKPAGVTAPADLERLRDAGGVSDDASRVEAAELVGRVLRTLDAEKREVFVLAELEQMTIAEVADALGINRNTAWSRLRAARQLFEAELDRLEGSGP
jgi:RNA polymerase sigma-70 factor, ECF subfamily